MKTIACIPGLWRNRSEFMKAIHDSTEGKYLFAGMIMMKIDDELSIGAEFCQKDKRMMASFAASGQSRFSEVELEKIDGHNSVVYLLQEAVCLENLHVIHGFVNVCLNAGGLGIKWENSGNAHTKDEWASYSLAKDSLKLMNPHVMLIVGEEHYFSCGMHIFGLPDVCISSNIENRKAGYILTEFNHYHIFESPQLRDGNTFSVDAESEKYKIKIGKDFIYGEVESLGNPFGRIELVAL